MSLIKDTFADRLQLAINKKKITITELSALSNIPVSSISCYLSGRIMKAGEDKVRILAQILEVNEGWLLGYENSMTSPDEDELDKLLRKSKPLLSEDDYGTLKFIMQRTIDKYEKSKK